MIPSQFEYVAPDSIEEAVSLLHTKPGAKLLAGGQSLLLDMTQQRASPSLLIDLRRTRGLRGIHAARNDGGVQIGAMTTCTEIAASALIRDGFTALAEAAESIGDMQVRNACTLGGNLAYNDPGADLPAAVLALDATIYAMGPKGERAIPAEKLFLAAYKTSLAPDEIITKVIIPPHPAGGRSAYEKFKNPANGYAICGVAASLVRSGGGTATGCRVAVAGATGSAARLHVVEAALGGKVPTPGSIAAAAARAADGLQCISDLHASAEYRAHLITSLTERALTRVCKL